MKRKERWIALLLCTAVMGMSVSGCGKSGEDQKDVGEEVGTIPTFITRAVASRESKLDNESVKEKIESASGITFDTVAIPYESWKEKINGMIVAEEKMDMINMISVPGEISSYIERNAILPLDDLLEEYAPNMLEAIPEEAWEVCKDEEGIIWALPGKESFTRGRIPVIREDWLEQLNMENPSTMADLEAYFEAVLNTDLNGNGQNDEIPMVCTYDGILYFLQNYYCGFAGDRYVDEEGVVKPWYMHENIYKMFSKLSEWYEKGYLYSEFDTITYEQAMDFATAERMGAYVTWYNDPIYGSAPLVKDNPDNPVSWAALNNLTDVEEGGRVAWYSNAPYRVDLTLSSSSTEESAASALKLIDWMYQSTDNYMLATYGIEGTHWEYANEEKTEFQLADDVSEKYASFYQLSEWYDTDKYPTLIVSDSDYATSQMYKVQEEAEALICEPDDDWYMTYDLSGTPAENLTADANDLIVEAYTRVIKGNYEQSDWDSVVENCWEMDGSIRSAVWTEQYSARKK